MRDANGIDPGGRDGFSEGGFPLTGWLRRCDFSDGLPPNTVILPDKGSNRRPQGKSDIGGVESLEMYG